MTGKILDGITVLDATRWVTGGFATLMLANQGAEIIKIERPQVGDDMRHSGPPFIAGESPYYWTINYGKQSVELNLKSEEGLNLVHELAEEADVFVENFRPGTADRLGIGYDDIAAVQDDIIYCSISAFGQTGPWSDRPGYDLLIQGLSGLMSVTGTEGDVPVKVGIPISDLLTGMWAGFGILNGLYQREVTGEGEYIEVGMLDSVIPWLSKQAGKVFAGEEPQPMGTRDPLHSPYQSFQAADGYVNIACGNQRAWEGLCAAIDRPDLLEDDRFASNPKRVEHMDALEAELEATLRDRTVDEWVSLIAEEHGIPAGPLQTVPEALDHDQVKHRAMIYDVQHTTAGAQPVVDHPVKYRDADHGFNTHAPVLGEHTRPVLRSIGYDDTEIDRLIAADVVGESGLEN